MSVDNVNVTVGSAVGDFYHRVCPEINWNCKPSIILTNIKKINVKTKKWYFSPFHQVMLLSIIPLTKSKTHSIKFCLPVGRFLRLRVQIIAITKTINAVINIIIIDDRLNTMSRPNTFQLTRGSL